MQLKYFFIFFCCLISCGLSFTATAQTKGTASNPYILEPSATTVAWGYYWSEAQPVLRVQSGDYVSLRNFHETI